MGSPAPPAPPGSRLGCQDSPGAAGPEAVSCAQWDGASFKAHPGTCGSCSREDKCEKSPQSWAGTCCSLGLCRGDVCSSQGGAGEDGTHLGWQVEHSAVLAVMGSACVGPPLLGSKSPPLLSPASGSRSQHAFPGWGHHNLQGAWKGVPMLHSQVGEGCSALRGGQAFFRHFCSGFSIQSDHLQASPALPFSPSAAAP